MANDPLDVEPEDVLADFRAGRVSVDGAARFYRVVLADGAVDRAGTAALRGRTRNERRNWNRAPGAHNIRAKLPRNTTKLGDHLVLARGLDSAVYACDCGTVLAPVGHSWKQQACHAELGAEDLGAEAGLHPGVRADAYACPGCGALLALEVRAQEELREFELAR